MSQASLFSQTLAPFDAKGSQAPAKLHKHAPSGAASMSVEHCMDMSAPHLHSMVHQRVKVSCKSGTVIGVMSRMSLCRTLWSA